MMTGAASRVWILVVAKTTIASLSQACIVRGQDLLCICGSLTSDGCGENRCTATVAYPSALPTPDSRLQTPDCYPDT